MTDKELYSLKEASNKTEIPQTTIRRWESEYSIEIRRNEDNSRYLNQNNIETLFRVKNMRDKNMPKHIIIESLREGIEPEILLSKEKMIHKEKEVKNIFNKIETLIVNDPPLRTFVTSEFKGFLLYEEIKEELKIEVKKSVQGEIEGDLKEILASYKSEINRRDELLTENMKLKKELKKEKRPVLSKVFG